jgi:hypothetical protein
MTRTRVKALATIAVAAAVGGCGNSSDQTTPAAAQRSPTAIQVTQSPVINEVALSTGSASKQISGTISAFYRATWHNQGSAACSLFSPAGVTGFLQAAKVAFPQSVNATTSCPQAMAFFNADLADSVNTLQQSGVNVSGNVLDNVGVQHIAVHGDLATAEAPQGVPEFIKPKRFLLVRRHGRWLINGSQKLGQTLPQVLAAARASGRLPATPAAQAKHRRRATPPATAKSALRSLPGG